MFLRMEEVEVQNIPPPLTISLRFYWTNLGSSALCAQTRFEGKSLLFSPKDLPCVVFLFRATEGLQCSPTGRLERLVREIAYYGSLHPPSRNARVNHRQSTAMERNYIALLRSCPRDDNAGSSNPAVVAVSGGCPCSQDKSKP